MANLRLAPALPLFPEPLHGKPIVGLVVDVRRLRRGGRAGARAGARARPPGARRDRAQALRRAPEDARPGGAARAALLLEVAPARPAHRRHHRHHLRAPRRRSASPLSTVPIFSFGGAMAGWPRTPPPSRTATPRTTSTSWRRGCRSSAGDADRHRAWVRGFFDALAPHSRGVYVNFTSDDAQSRVQAGLQPGSSGSRLRTLKTAYDPTNFFRRQRQHPAAG